VAAIASIRATTETGQLPGGQRAPPDGDAGGRRGAGLGNL